MQDSEMDNLIGEFEDASETPGGGDWKDGNPDSAIEHLEFDIDSWEGPKDISKWVLKYVCEKKDMAQCQIARLFKVDDAYVCRVRSGKQKLSMERLLQLSRHLNIPLPILIAESTAFSAPHVWERHLASDEGWRTKRVLSRRATLEQELTVLNDRLPEIAKTLEAYCARVQNSDGDRILLARRLLRLCEEGQGSLVSLVECLDEAVRALTSNPN